MTFFSAITIRGKLAAASGAALALVVAVGVFGLFQLHSVNSVTKDLRDVWLPKIETLNKIQSKITEHRLLATRRTQTTNFRELAPIARNLDAALTALKLAEETYSRGVASETERSLFAQYRAQWLTYETTLASVLQRLEAGEISVALQEFNKTTLLAFDAAAEKLERLVAFSKERTSAATTRAQRVYHVAVELTIAVIVLAALAAAGAMVWTTRMVSLPILRVTEAMRRLTAGDHTVGSTEDPNRKDEIGVLARAVAGYRDTLVHSYHMARHDALTGLANRNLFRERIEDGLQRVRRGDSMAVLCLDLDYFKHVNDSLGHPIGDALLKVVAERLRTTVREGDTIARLGGDEFAVLQHGLKQPTGATTLAERLIEVLSAPYDIGGHQVIIGTSIGIAVAPDDGDEAAQLMKNADIALYRSKSDGRGRCHFFKPEMDAATKARRALELEIRRALNACEFELHYQPIINSETKQVSCCEALLRWRHPERGLVLPGEFLALAEEIGLIVPLGEWILRQACLDAVKWPEHIRVAVNVSPVQFKLGRLMETVIRALAASELAPSRLELEITEGVLLTEHSTTLEVLHQLHELGVKIAMDDFGTGYSSLSYLRSFPFDKLKIDQSFVRDMSNASSLSIVRALTGLCRSLDIVTTAEGVETIEQLESIRAEGCTEIQGFLVRAARPAAELPTFFENAHKLSVAA
jgi:diguanylate cyclase (GGDEF)-like protein